MSSTQPQSEYKTPTPSPRVEKKNNKQSTPIRNTTPPDDTLQTALALTMLNPPSTKKTLFSVPSSHGNSGSSRKKKKKSRRKSRKKSKRKRRGKSIKKRRRKTRRTRVKKR